MNVSSKVRHDWRYYVLTHIALSRRRLSGSQFFQLICVFFSNDEKDASYDIANHKLQRLCLNQSLLGGGQAFCVRFDKSMVILN